MYLFINFYFILKTNITKINLIVAIMLSVPFIICLLVIKEKPSSPPNAIAE